MVFNIQPRWRTYFWLCFLSFTLIRCSSVKNINSPGTVELSAMIHSGKFTFVAERVNPLRGRARQLTSSYDVKVSKDSLISYLPYFGRSHRAPIDPTKGGIKFTSTDFTINTDTKDEKKWVISVIPHDNVPVQSLNFTIFGNGSTTLHVTNTYRDPIVFHGYIQKEK